MRARNLVPFLILALGAGNARANDCVQLGVDGARSRSSTEKTGAIFSPSWTYTLASGKIVATPLAVDGMVVVAGTGGTMSALGVDGKLIWSRGLDGGVGATPAASRGHLVTATLNGNLYGLDLANGAIGWQRSFGGLNYASPVLVKSATTGLHDSVVLPAGYPDSQVHRLDVATGEPVWQTEPGAIAGLMYSSPAVAGNRTIIGMNGGEFQSLDIASGTTEWSFQPGGIVYLSSPLVVDQRVYVFPGDASVQVFAAGLADGQPVAGFPLSIPDPAPVAGGQMLGRGPAVSSPVMVDGVLIVQLRRNDMLKQPSGPAKVVMREYVVGIDPTVPRVLWQHAVGSTTVDNNNAVPELNTCPTPVGFATDTGSFIAASSSIWAHLSVLDVKTGEERWGAPLSGAGRSSPVFSNGQLFVGTDAGVLHAFSSDRNHPPRPPTRLAPTDEVALTTANSVLTWDGASDADGDALSYRVRLQEEGHPETMVETKTEAGVTTIPVTLRADVSYTFVVRSRDASGALSVWSAPQRFRVTAAPVAAPVVPVDEVQPPLPVAMPAEDTLPEAPAMNPGPLPAAPPVVASTAMDATPVTAAAPAAPLADPQAATGLADAGAAEPVGCAVGGRGTGGGASAATVLMLALALLRTARRRGAATR